MLKKLTKLFTKNNGTLNFSRKSILVVDDSELDRKIIAKLLSKTNYQLFFAENGTVALQLAQEHRPDLILLDGIMPGLSGPEVCRILKKDLDLKHIPIIFLTGMDSPTYIVNCYNIGAEQYLNKPINSKELISQIEVTLKEFDLAQ